MPTVVKTAAHIPNLGGTKLGRFYFDAGVQRQLENGAREEV